MEIVWEKSKNPVGRSVCNVEICPDWVEEVELMDKNAEQPIFVESIKKIIHEFGSDRVNVEIYNGNISACDAIWFAVNTRSTALKEGDRTHKFSAVIFNKKIDRTDPDFMCQSIQGKSKFGWSSPENKMFGVLSEPFESSPLSKKLNAELDQLNNKDRFQRITTEVIENVKNDINNSLANERYRETLLQRFVQRMESPISHL
ncbi:hypothetical protein N9M08_07050 [Porticoccaceae bacterium]|nr:hypothetical protein [Porticoccaceae bacterium]MDA8788893.1 hypothetical protein [Porticoccaceae bacterium]MDB2343803.1 hypothetical protein [Porticoccaceae bacterium]